ncbi:hypothetical protein ACFX2F_006203 [Malus domestica]
MRLQLGFHQNANWVCEIQIRGAAPSNSGFIDSSFVQVRWQRLQVWLRTRGCRFDDMGLTVSNSMLQ